MYKHDPTTAVVARIVDLNSSSIYEICSCWIPVTVEYMRKAVCITWYVAHINCYSCSSQLFTTAKYSCSIINDKLRKALSKLNISAQKRVFLILSMR